jgi:hypothetical protein
VRLDGDEDENKVFNSIGPSVVAPVNILRSMLGISLIRDRTLTHVHT